MSEIKAVHILKTLSEKEFSEFKKFACSPYFNEGRNLLPLINELKKYYPAYSNKNFTKENIFQALYPGEKYKAGTINKLFSRASKLAEKFLRQKAFEKNVFQGNTVQAKEFSERKLAKLYKQKIEETETWLETQSVFGINFFENRKTLEIIKSDYLLANRDLYKSSKDMLARSDFNLLDLVLKHIYSLQDLILFSSELNLNIDNSLVRRANDFINLDGIMKLLKEANNPYSSVLELKYYELVSMTNLDMKSYGRYKEAVIDNLKKLSWAEKFNVFTVMASICVLGNRKNSGMFTNESIEVSRLMIDENSYAINRNNYTSLPHYMSILNWFINYKEDRYFEKLVKNFGSNLEPEYRESILAYSYMSKYFSDGNYEEALRYNSKINYDHHLLRINARMLLLRLYYELGYTEELISLLDSTQKYFSSIDNYSPTHLNKILNQVKYIKKLYRFRDDAVQIGILKKELLKDNELINKDWLLEKISEAKPGS